MFVVSWVGVVVGGVVVLFVVDVLGDDVDYFVYCIGVI